jgi:hypothetical protein
MVAGWCWRSRPAARRAGGLRAGRRGFAGIAEGRHLAARIERAGGRIAVMALDEPYYFAHLYDGPNACHWPVEKIAEAVAAFVREMRTLFPELIVGDIEPTPVPVSAAGLAGWLDAYEAAAGEPFGFLHLDMDWGRHDWVAMAHDIQDRAKSRGVPLGMIYNGGAAPLRERWIQIGGERIKAYEAAGPAADHASSSPGWSSQTTRCQRPIQRPSGLVLRTSGLRRIGHTNERPGGNSPCAGRRRRRPSSLVRPRRARSMATSTRSGTLAAGRCSGSRSSSTARRMSGPSGLRWPGAGGRHGPRRARSEGRRPARAAPFHGFTSEGMTLEFTPPEPWQNLTRSGSRPANRPRGLPGGDRGARSSGAGATRSAQGGKQVEGSTVAAAECSEVALVE